MKINREFDGGWTLAGLGMAAFSIGLGFGFWAGLGVFWFGFAIGGEIQRKSNQILDVLEQSK